MKYFAYGSNMSIRRLQQRCPSATRIGVFVLFEHTLRWHKPSKDGSAKCDACAASAAPMNSVYGVLFEIDDSEKPDLDKAEGLGFGYEEKKVCVFNPSGMIEAVTYTATVTDDSLRPYTWYHLHVQMGSYEADLPLDYVRRYISSVDPIQDPDAMRDAKERQIYNI